MINRSLAPLLLDAIAYSPATALLGPRQDRTGSGADIDLLLSLPNGNQWAIEIKRSLAPKVASGFHEACADLRPTKRYVVYPGTERYRLATDIEAISLEELASELTGS